MTRNAREAAPDDWIEYEELSRLAGWNPEPRELKELRRAGVLQPGYQEHPPGVRGSVGFYPRDAGAQLRRIAELRNRYRRFDELLLALWWEGRWVDRGNLRDALAALMDDAGLREVRDLTDRYPDVYDRADVVLAEVHKRARRSPILRHLRSQILGHRLVDLDTVVYALALLAFGEEPAWESKRGPTQGDG